MIFIIIILLGIVFYQSRVIDKLNAKIYLLQKQLDQPQTEAKETVVEKADVQIAQDDIVETSTVETNNIKTASAVTETTQKVSVKPAQEPKQQMSSADSKNLSILITGSVLIVLAAIVFLTTAWQTIPDFIKTVVLFLVAFVFIGASKISKEKYNLEKASKTFFYIGMAYLPICLLSISIFGLLGTYLSVSGEGKYIYLGASTLILAVLYYYISKNSNDRYLFYGSLLSQIFSVILFTLMFEERLFLVFINLLLYNLLLILITKDKLFEVIVHVIPGAIAIGTLALVHDEIGSWYFIFASLLVAINFLALELKKTHLAKSALFNLFLFIFGFSLIFKESLGLDDGTCQVLATLFTVAVYAVETFAFSNIKENNYLLITTRVSCLIAMSYIHFGSFAEPDKMIIPSYIIAVLIEAMLVFNLKTSKKSLYKYLSYAFSNIILADIHYNFFKDTNLIYYVPMITTTVIMLYELYSPKEKDEFMPIYIAGFEAVAICFLGLKDLQVNAVLAIIFTMFSLYYNKKTNSIQALNALPLLCVLPCITDSNLSNELQLGILLLSTIGLTYLSVTSENINVYTVMSGIYLVIAGNKLTSTYFIATIYILWSSMHVYFFKEDKAKDIFKVLTAIFTTGLYYTIIKDLELDSITLFNLFGTIACGMYIIKFVIQKYYKETDVLEYIFWGFTYLYALGNYADSVDGIIFSALILGIIFLSYYKKYGATFLAGIIAILVNGFALTKTFWFSIPWWIYLLVVGGILVAFAIRNEANENKQKLSVGSVLKEIKDKIEDKE